MSMRNLMNAFTTHRYVKDLQTFVRFPTVSAQADRYPGALQECAAWLAQHLRKVVGMKEVWLDNAATPAPVVVGEWLSAGRSAPTLLVYGHYDVQPPEPFGAWRSPPFDPLVQGLHLYGRGASDNKGQLFAHLKAIESLLRRHGALPVNVRCVLEGAEEIGSPGLGNFFQRHRDKLRADVAVVSDMAMPAADQPALTYGLRGVLYVELRVWHNIPDLHSGNFGGAVEGPLQAIAKLMASLFHPDGSIAIDGFYSDVQHMSPAERRLIARQPKLTNDEIPELDNLPPGGERNLESYERTALRPSLTICGMSGGYSGPGLKAIVPSSAGVKLDFRLVVGQDPVRIFHLLDRWIHRNLAQGMKYAVANLMSIPAVATPVDHPAVHAAAAALTEAFGRQPMMLRSGGTVPVVYLLKTILQTPSVLMGFGLPGDRIHAPNERFFLPNFFRSIRASRLFMTYLSHYKKNVNTIQSL